jgi:hypothetical protein
MSIVALERSKHLRRYGNLLGREGMSQRVIAAVTDFDGSYKGAMRLAGRLKAIGQMAASDSYWDEQVDRGFMHELMLGDRPAEAIAPLSDPPPRTPKPSDD